MTESISFECPQCGFPLEGDENTQLTCPSCGSTVTVPGAPKDEKPQGSPFSVKLAQLNKEIEEMQRLIDQGNGDPELLELLNLEKEELVNQQGNSKPS